MRAVTKPDGRPHKQSFHDVRQENGKGPPGLLNGVIPAIKSQDLRDIALFEARRQRIAVCAVLDLGHCAGLQRVATVGARDVTVGRCSAIHRDECATASWTSAGQRLRIGK